MYNWVNDRKFSSSRISSSFNVIPKNFNGWVKASFESITSSQLPVIKEEEGYVSGEESESQSQQKFLPDAVRKKRCAKKDSHYIRNLKPDLPETVQYTREEIKSTKTFTKLPPLVNINCLMNTDIKQSHHIWDTNFGKRLIQGKTYNSVKVDKINSFDNTETFKSEKSSSGCSVVSQESMGKSLTEQNFKNAGGDTRDGTHKRGIKKKKKNTSKPQGLSKKLCQENEYPDDNIKSTKTKSSTKITQISSKESLKKNKSKEDNIEISSTVSSFSKNKHFLTECVKSILDNTPGQLECEHCKEQFSNIEELCAHNKQHESKKETCLLCEKVFYNPTEFVQHLLTHESVDRFSCKKCKKYFPSLKKYKQHCHDFHSVPEKASSHQSHVDIEYVKKWLPKYECKRCKMEFNTEKEQEEHKRNHIKQDLVGAYLLSSKSMTEA